MAGHRIAHATLKGPSVVKEIVIASVLGLAAGSLWKMHHWNEQRKVRSVMRWHCSVDLCLVIAGKTLGTVGIIF
ncbi:hypothetical protein H5410_013031 [Solanum commersonii]|uniref:Cytochrome c oxidase subunit 5C n=1 Tax=Solanum commersonii TaxID=4109 RepID=A0A9J6ATB7_SOLCO|nr:hypothetical protein H5410_013031 [Solanum commersonii]